MRTFTVLSIVFCACFQSLANEKASGDAKAGATKAKACTACHNAVISLKERGIDMIVRQINAIRAGDKDHPPGLDELDAKDIADIAAFLNSD